MTADEPAGHDLTGVEVRLLLHDGRYRRVDDASGDLTFGALRLGRWQVFPVPVQPEVFPEQDGYLIKIHYDMVVERGTPEPSWFEIGVEFSVMKGLATVNDAVPRHFAVPDGPTTYGLDRRLNFVAGEGVSVPAAHATVYQFGTGQSTVRWRYRAVEASGVPEGSYTAWTTLVVPARSAHVVVTVSARFDFDAEDAAVYNPVDMPASFVLRLLDAPPLPESFAAPVDRVDPDNRRSPRAAASRPRVFVCYAHDNKPHKRAVLRFAEFLVDTCGFDTRLDRWEEHRKKDWGIWALKHITAADYVLVIASRACRKAADGLADSHTNQGIQWEMSILRDLLAAERDEWMEKILPVVLPGQSTADIPLFLQPKNADYYEVSDFTVAGAADLIRVITGQPAHIRPPMARDIPKLPPLES